MAEIDKLFEHIDDIEIAMMTTRRPDGHLYSRAMATQKRAAGADLWFVTLEGSGKLDEIAFDPHVNLSYYKDRTREWVSVSGYATISRDRDTIRELWAPDWQAWFPKGDDPRHGTADDPRMVLVGRQRPLGVVSGSEQAAAGRAVRAREGLSDGLDARAR